MEFEGLFSSTRWEILQLLSEKGRSPMELADALKTTSANISQQLRLLELAGLVKSERTRDADKKKPRVIYSLADNYSYVVMCTSNFASKKLLPLSTYHNFILRSMLVADYEYHKHLGLLYHELNGHMADLAMVAVDNTAANLRVVVVADKRALSALDKALAKSPLSKDVEFSFIQKSEFKESGGLLVLYKGDDDGKM